MALIATARGIGKSHRASLSHGLPGKRAFTPVLDGLCPAMTKSEGVAHGRAGAGGAATLHGHLRGHAPVNWLLLSASRETHYHSPRLRIRPGKSGLAQHDTSIDRGAVHPSP